MAAECGYGRDHRPDRYRTRDESLRRPWMCGNGSVALSDPEPTAPQIFRSGRWLPAQCATTTLFSVGQDGRVSA